MSLKFGIYLVEQRIITPEQFCGLVKVQQEATVSIANIAIRKNILSINQVARVLDMVESSAGKTFLQIALENDLLDAADANQLLREQELSSPSIRQLCVECGLLTQRQSTVLYHHFEKAVAKSKLRSHAGSTQTPQPKGRTSEPTTSSTTQSETKTSTSGPRAPKYQQKPLVVNPYEQAQF